MEISENIKSAEQIHSETIDKINKRYPSLCDRAKELSEDGKLRYCVNPKRDPAGHIICNGSCIGEIINGTTIGIHACPDTDMLFYLKQYKK